MTNNNMYFIANWKMHGNTKDIERTKSIIRLTKLNKYRKNKIIYCPPYTLLKDFFNKVKKTRISIGAQNCHKNFDYGPFTGSVNAAMIKKAGANYIILGHSENRISGDTNALIKKKIASSLNQNLNIVFCIGETLQEKNQNKTLEILRSQIIESIGINFNFNKIIIAYEPVWSIGTGKIPKIKELNKIFIFIKNEFRKNFKIKKNPTVLYGGSVNDKNIGLFSSNPFIDGFLIGGASKSPKKFIDIIKNYYK